MLGHLRSGSAVRFAVILAALMSLAGSAGLHPEPGDWLGSAGELGVAAAPHGGACVPVPHLCQLCVLHFACSLAPSGPATLAALPAVSAVVQRRASLTGRIERRQHEGRAPPLTS